MKKDIEILEDMLTSLVDLLIEKGIMTEEEYEERVKRKLSESEELTDFEELEK